MLSQKRRETNYNMLKWLSNTAPRVWHTRGFMAYALWPFSLGFASVAAIRRFIFTVIIKPEVLPVPVIVVGNLTVGGTGKTPFVIALAKALKARGYSPGIVTRGYKGRTSKRMPVLVTSASDARAVGDEAILLARQSGCPVIAWRKRAEAVKRLRARNPKVDVIISDDGLQHYALARQVNIVMMDALRRWGNGFYLPAGPLRESPRRLATIDCVISNGGMAEEAHWQMITGLSKSLCRINNPNERMPLAAYVGKTVHAMAGIGVPERFFSALEAASIQVIRHAFPDHYQYRQIDFRFNDDLPIIMTEKDAVKCRGIAPQHAWYVELEASIPEECIDHIIKRLHHGQKIA